MGRRAVKTGEPGDRPASGVALRRVAARREPATRERGWRPTSARVRSVATAVRGCAASRRLAMSHRFRPGARSLGARPRRCVAAPSARPPRQVAAGRRAPRSSIRVVGHRGARPAAARRPARRRHRDRRATRSRAPARRASPSCCSASPASRSSRTAARARLSGVFLRGANRSQTLVLIDGIRDRVVERGRDVARSDSARPDRPHRDPARTGVEPLRRGRDRRRHPGVHAPRDGDASPATRARATAPTARGT